MTPNSERPTGRRARAAGESRPLAAANSTRAFDPRGLRDSTPDGDAKERNGSIGANPRRAQVRPGRAGRGLLPLLGLLALAVIATAGWFVSRARENPNDGAELAPPPTAPGSSAPSGATPGAPGAGAPRTEVPMELSTALEVGRSATRPRPEPTAFDERLLDGKGRIRGFVQAAPGIDFPETWTLRVGPSPSLIGHDRAETRELEFHAGEKEFALEDLPLGGYAISARAFGMASSESHLLLARPGETDLYVVLQFAITSVVDGTVRLEDTSTVAGLELALEPDPSGPRITAITDALGRFAFTDVREGAYRLHFGRPESPVRESVEVKVLGHVEHLPDLVVPKLCELLVRVEREPGLPAVGVRLEGFGDKGGRFTAVTDERGEYRARFLPAGRITVDAMAADGRHARGRQVVDASTVQVLAIGLGK